METSNKQPPFMRTTVEEVFASEASPSLPECQHDDAASSEALGGDLGEECSRSLAGNESVDGDWEPEPEDNPPAAQYEEESDRQSAASSHGFRGQVAVEA